MDRVKGAMRPSGPFATHNAVNPYDFDVAHRRLAWLLRLSVSINVVLGFAFAVSLSMMTELFPLKEIRPALLRIDPADNRIYEVVPATEEVEGFEVFLEATSARFIKSLLEVDGATQQRRFEEAMTLMDADFFSEWQEENIPLIQKALDAGLRREIIVNSVHLDRRFADVNEWQYSVRFTRIDRYPNAQPERKALIAYLRLTTVPFETNALELYENPLGIRVLDMTVKTPLTTP